ncbi:hypothetical protein H7Y40_00505 [Pedobacter sp.]|nr:hypothetical protein [Candidatus Saccharibacteria bacterium]
MQSVILIESSKKMKISKVFHHWRQYMTLNNGAVAVALLIALSWLWGTVVTLQKNFVLQQQVGALDQQVQIAEIENTNLGFQRQYFKSSEYLELAAREKLGKAAPGEKLIILPPTVKSPAASVPAPATSVEASNFQQWMRFFFGKNAS